MECGHLKEVAGNNRKAIIGALIADRRLGVAV